MSAAPTLPITSIRVAFVGFSNFERSSLATYFRLAAERQPPYELVHTLTDADFLVADADHTPSVQLVVVTERMAETIFIGSQAPEGAACLLRRPIDALHVMRTLDALAYRSGRVSLPAQSAPTKRATELARTLQPAIDPESGVIVQSMLHMPAPAAPPSSSPRPVPASPAYESPWPTPRPDPPIPTAAPAFASPRVAARSPLTTPSRQAPVLPGAARVYAAPTEFVGPPAPARALLVDDSAIALRFLALRLAPWSLRTDMVSTSAEALLQLSKRPYDFVFLDLELGPDSDLDGLALCHHIKHNALAMSASLVMVSAHHSEIDRARGSLAGCDGYLAKPLDESELYALLRRQGLAPPAGAPVRPPATAGVWPA